MTTFIFIFIILVIVFLPIIILSGDLYELYNFYKTIKTKYKNSSNSHTMLKSMLKVHKRNGTFFYSLIAKRFLKKIKKHGHNKK